VIGVHSGSLAEKQGIEEGDWICHPAQDGDKKPDLILGEFRHVVAATKTTDRPFSAYVLRKKEAALPLPAATTSTPNKGRLTCAHNLKPYIRCN
jgi:hypothetical protein